MKLLAVYLTALLPILASGKAIPVLSPRADISCNNARALADLSLLCERSIKLYHGVGFDNAAGSQVFNIHEKGECYLMPANGWRDTPVGSIELGPETECHFWAQTNCKGDKRQIGVGLGLADFSNRPGGMSGSEAFIWKSFRCWAPHREDWADQPYREATQGTIIDEKGA